MPKERRRRKTVMISAVAERFDIHPQTLRLYEREGLISPERSAGNTRLYDDETLERLELILTLTRELGVNLAGVEVILNLRRQLDELREELDRAVAASRRRAAERETEERRYALVHVSRGPLVRRG